MKMPAIVMDAQERLYVRATRSPDLFRREVASLTAGHAELLYCSVLPHGISAHMLLDRLALDFPASRNESGLILTADFQAVVKRIRRITEKEPRRRRLFRAGVRLLRRALLGTTPRMAGG